jgi:hypothetical protein
MRFLTAPAGRGYSNGRNEFNCGCGRRPRHRVFWHVLTGGRHLYIDNSYVMKQSKGKANPPAVIAMLKKKLG